MFNMDVLIVFITVGIPILGGFLLIAHRLRLQQEQFKMMMEERKLLIQNGATDLPPVSLPAMSGRWRRPFHHLRVGIVFTLVAVTAGTYAAVNGGKLDMFHGTIPNVLIWIVGAIGVAHLALHFVRVAYDKQYRAQGQYQDQAGNGYHDAPAPH